MDAVDPAQIWCWRFPYPPSINHYWRHVGHKVLVSKEGRCYRTALAEALLVQGGRPPAPLAGRLIVHIDVHPPDRRARDIDNLTKSTLDALQHAGVYHDDSQIDDLRLQRQAIHAGGAIVVCITEL